MLTVKINGQYIDLFEGTRIPYRYNNNMFETDVFTGDYSFPMDFPPTNNNKKVFEFIDMVNAATPFTKRFAAEIYDGAVMVLRNKFVMRKASPKGFQGNFIGGASLLDDLKNKKLNEIDLGGKISVKTKKQAITYYFFGGTPLFVVYKHPKVTYAKVTGTSLANLAANINSTPYHYDGVNYTLNATVPDSSHIKIEATWIGEDPLLNLATYDGSVFSVLSISTWYRDFLLRQDEWNDYLNDFVIGKEAAAASCFPVMVYEAQTRQLLVPAPHTYTGWTTYVNQWDIVAGKIDIRSGASPWIVLFPKVRYVLKQIFAEAGCTVEGDMFTDADLLKLVIYSNYTIDEFVYQPYDTTIFKYILYPETYDLKDHVPKVTIGYFLVALKKLFNLCIEVKNDVAGLYTTNYLLENWTSVDWTKKVVPGYEINDAGYKGYRFEYNWESDAYRELFIRDNLDGYTIIEPNYFLIGAPPSRNCLTLNTTSNKYFHPTYDGSDNFVVWQYFCENTFAIDVDDAGVVITADSSTNMMQQDLAAAWRVPASTHELKVHAESVEKDTELGLRFLLDYGFQITNDGSYPGSQIPYGSSDNLDPLLHVIGNRTLFWGGQYGLYEKSWKKFIEYMRYAKEVIVYVRLSSTDVSQLSIAKMRVSIAGQEFIVKVLDAEFPCDRPMKATLIKR